MRNIFPERPLYNIIPRNPIVLASPNEMVRRGSSDGGYIGDDAAPGIDVSAP